MRASALIPVAAIAACVCALVVRPAAPPVLYELATYERGARYVRDFDLTATDCSTALRSWVYAGAADATAIRCEVQP